MLQTPNQGAGIYLHIPFCKRACHYCNFHFSTSLSLKNEFLSAILKEISLQRNFLEAIPVATIYFGGGTPSLLSPDELNSILEALRTHFSIAADAEISLEANPDDITLEKARAWHSLGVNRLSVGIQSFFQQDLLWMNRAHDEQQARNCVPILRQAGFSNFSIDLIYGGPTLPDAHWMKNLQQAVDWKIPHLSCYALTVEPRTALDTLIRKKRLADVEPEDQARQFLMMSDYLQEKGYDHYEISNFALSGFRSRHNSAYWQGVPYLGLGPSAHSYKDKKRRWNISNNALYIKAMESGILSFEEESLTAVQQYNEYIMTALRTEQGIDLKKASSDPEALLKKARKFIDAGNLEHTQGYLRLTRGGKLYADGIAADLFEE